MNNVDKIMQYIQAVQKKPTVIDGKVYDSKVQRIQLGKAFFMRDSCNSCGSCCVPESNVYTEYEYQKIRNQREMINPKITAWENECNITRELFGLNKSPLLTYEEYEQFIEDLEKVQINVNGQLRNIYVYPLRKQVLKLAVKEKEKDCCTWVTEIKPGVFICKIHPIVSITCVMPHLTMRVSTRGTLRIAAQQFGRNWAMNCSVCFQNPKDEEDFESIKDSKCAKLGHLLMDASSLGIDTYLPDIIDYIKKIPYDGYENYLERDIVNLHTSSLQRLIEEGE